MVMVLLRPLGPETMTMVPWSRATSQTRMILAVMTVSTKVVFWLSSTLRRRWRTRSMYWSMPAWYLPSQIFQMVIQWTLTNSVRAEQEPWSCSAA